MKKRLLIVIIIAAVLVAALGGAYLLSYDRINNQIPLIDGMYFNMSPKQTTKILGEPSEMEHDANVSGKYIYTYKTAVFDKKATVTCFFVDDRKLTEVYIDWEGDVEGIGTQVRDRIYDCYHDHRYFYERESTSATSVEKHRSMGIDNGAVGTYFGIDETPTHLSVSCIFLR